MPDQQWIQQAAEQTIERLLPRLKSLLPDSPEAQTRFTRRLYQEFPRAFGHLYTLYGHQYDFFYHLEQILTTIAESFTARGRELRERDVAREADPLWFQREDMVGAVCYVDRFGGTLAGVQKHIPYLQELGITYLHLMPLFRTPEGNSDGGYAISDYREVNPDLGTMAELAALAEALHEVGINLVLDFVFNHTADDHIWAKRALAGDSTYRDYYYIFPDRTQPDRYEPHLREIFPEQAPGSFTYREELNGWVWTTFNRFQWDLNYSNPEVFNAMLGEMLFLANKGTDVLRLDAVAFIWKRLGTPCENLPEVHDVIRAFNALVQIAAPAMLFKSEAIVHPRDVASYISPKEASISYNPTFMALIWEALATREVKLLRHSMSKRYTLPQGTSWVNYVRLHDDIGWSFADEDAAEVGINGFDHRQFLNRFYTSDFPGSFATGLPFNYNPVTRDMRICGMTASLAGLEQAEKLQNDLYREHALRRIIMIESLIIAAGGIPLLYLGDELAMRNDYSFRDDPALRDDNRWVHRPYFDWERAETRDSTATNTGRVYQAVWHLLHVRKRTRTFADRQTTFFDTQNPHVLGFVRNYQTLVLANFSEFEQAVNVSVLQAYWDRPTRTADLVTGKDYPIEDKVTLAPYDFVWLAESTLL